MLRVLPPTFKPVNSLICCKTGRAKYRYSTRFEAMLQDECMFFGARFSVTEIAFSQIGRSKFAGQSVVVGVFSRLNFTGVFLFVL